MEIKEDILLSEKQLKFWEKLCEFHNKNKLNFKLSKPGERQYFDLKINSKYHIRLSMNSLKKEFQVGFYIENDKLLYNYLLENKQEIESNFGFDLIWQNFENKKSSVIYTIINFDINNMSEWDNYLYIILNKSQKISETFEKFSEIYYETEDNSSEIKKIENTILEKESLENEILDEKDGIFKKILKKLFPFFYKKENKQDSLKNEEKIILEKNRDFNPQELKKEVTEVVESQEEVKVESSISEELETSLEFENLQEETSEEENNIFTEEPLIKLESKQEDVELLGKTSEEVIFEEKDNFNPQELKEEVKEIMELQENTEEKPFISNELEILVEAESSQEEIPNTSQSESSLEQKEENEVNTVKELPINKGYEKCSYMNGIKIGKAFYYYFNGDKEEYIYVDGIKEGEAIYYYSNGNKEEYTYVDGIKEGEAVCYYPNGDKEEYKYVNGIPVGRKFIQKHMDLIEKEKDYEEKIIKPVSEIESLKDENKVNTMKDLPINKGYEKCSYMNGIKIGKAFYYYFNGDKEEYIYVDGIKEGEAIYYYSNGDKEEYTYVDGIKEGKAVCYYPNGNKEEYKYVNGVLVERKLIQRHMDLIEKEEDYQEKVIKPVSEIESLKDENVESLENVLVENDLNTEEEVKKESNNEKIIASESETLNEKKSKIIKRKISEDLLIQNILSEEEMKIFGERLGLILKNGDDKIKYSPKIVNFLVSVAYYEGFSSGGYWNKVFDVLGMKFIGTRYLHLTDILRETLQRKRLFIDDSTQWAYNTIIAHTIVPLKGGAFYKYLDFAYSFYDSIDSDINSISEEDLKLMVKELLEKEKDSPFILKGTKLAIENCLNMVVEYFTEILYYIDILDSQKEDFSSLGNVIKEKIKEWYDYNLSRGFSIKKNTEENFLENDKEEVISITNKIGTLKFTCDTLGVNIETPKMLFDYSINEAYIKIGESKIMLNYKKIGSKFVVGSKKITRKSFDFKLIKLFINDKLVKEWDNKIIFFKENGKNIKPKQTKNNIYELDIRKVRILFDDSYSIFSTTKENKEISETNITKGIKYADLNLEDIYYLKKNNEVIIIKSISKDEEPEVIVENNMIIKNILIAEKPVFNRHPQIFIPYTLPEKYKVFINDEPVEVKEGFNTINFKESGYYDIKICKGIKNTRETRVIRREKQYFYFEDLNIVFYNEDGEKEYLFSHRDKKPIGNYNFDTEGISKVIYNGKEIEKCGNTFDLYIDNGFKKEFSFQMVSEGKEYQATGKMRVLEWSLDGENYFPEYNKNLLYEDIKNKVLTIKVENLVGDVIFYANQQKIGENKVDFKYHQDKLKENLGKNIGIRAEFRLSSGIYKEALFKIRFESKVKSITYDKDTKLLDVKVRGKINDMILQIKDSNDEIVYKKDKLELDNKIAIDLVGKYKVEVLLEEESFDFFAEDDGETVLYDNFLEF